MRAKLDTTYDEALKKDNPDVNVVVDLTKIDTLWNRPTRLDPNS